MPLPLTLEESSLSTTPIRSLLYRTGAPSLRATGLPSKSLSTTSFKDPLSNIEPSLVFPQVPCDLTPGCLVHTGFLASWVALKAQTLAGLKTATAAYPKYTIAVTGHSLGAAIATIATGYIRKAGYKADVYTYGSPRVGNSYFVKFVTEQAGAEFRITHEADPIPRLPPILFNFRHTSPEYWMKEPTASAADFTVCSGYASIACNAGQTGFDMNLHGDYFEPVNGCEALPGTPWRRDLTDAQLAKQLAEWSKEDVSFAVGLVDRLV